jgi:hypothetical protein
MPRNGASFLAKIPVLWIVLGLIFDAIGTNVGYFFKYRQLLARGSNASRTVTRLSRRITGSSTTPLKPPGGHIFSKGGQVSENPEFEQLKVGDAVSIRYLPDDPSASCLGDPGLLLRNEEQTILGMIIIFPTLVLAVLSVKYPGFRAWLTK